MAKPVVIFLMGATASGKTALAMQLHDALGCDLINVDSAQIYRQLNIGAAKPDTLTLQQYPHALIDIRDPSQVYSVAEFRDDALAAIEHSTAAGRIPVLVGGSMMYFKALIDDLAEMPEADPAMRQEIKAWAEREGWPAVHAHLAEIDPEMAASIHPHHSHRISRALEVYRCSGKTMTQLRREQAASTTPGLLDRYHVVAFALVLENRAELHARIEARFDQMLAEGLVEEVASLRARGDLDLTLPSMRSVGYRQVWQYLDGECDYATMRERGVAATRQLAKRQLTWLRNWPYPLKYLDASETPDQLLQRITSEVTKF
ncbi:MAG TPA: tRNA (adenosine(37)-N6)-dimethylallyltransferase MiaA [Pseudomonadales bacterium]|nr:tRNA (adenosine(37)-N6)-dimethylallyltransferase MiaA [Pseudomonadales bacterium]